MGPVGVILDEGLDALGDAFPVALEGRRAGSSGTAATGDTLPGLGDILPGVGERLPGADVVFESERVDRFKSPGSPRLEWRSRSNSVTA